MKKSKEYSTWESLPDTLTAMHISQFLGISRRRVYELFQIQADKGGIPHFRIGASKRVEKEDFRQWVTQMKERNRIIIN
ncbi:helix-turn-helix domain-containing protein [Alkalihalobacillus sp. LMS39]|uniref:helix-turn-helix domain-containing protein n=1 Tax=Alkalihalobacillus sp. LMS39 TaxID=2924032 RepID=UPI001FB25FE3|nr:helix-turn-helix domain-containing protein [Alkalihalobacillus sp. LMS39]UOE94394.1 helix-turn-helix domain-containing protein [Alkalihalobacillus sp. LMS39]